jgi:predicted O-methyltransferase YrrM
MHRLRQIPRETGQFIALLAASAPVGTWMEIGTSAGYSSLWLALACRQVGKKIITFEVLPEKAALAEQSFRLAEVEDVVELVVGDARDHIGQHSGISFCFLDARWDTGRRQRDKPRKRPEADARYSTERYESRRNDRPNRKRRSGL